MTIKWVFETTDAEFGTELWITDGTVEGTVLLKDIVAPGFTGTHSYAQLGDGRVLFSGYDAEHSLELWVTDGTNAGTALLKDINLGGASYPRDLTSLADGRVVFSAGNTVNGNIELWITDGTDAGTVLLKDLYPGGDATSSFPTGFTALGNGLVVFSAEDWATSSGVGLYVTDGTAGGTVRLLDLDVTRNGENPFHLLGDDQAVVTVGGSFPFDAVELWVTDGTAAGTVMLAKFENHGSRLEGFTLLGDGRLLFSGSAETPIGRGLWVTDGTAAGTLLVEPAVAFAQAPGITLADGRVMYGGQDGNGSNIGVYVSDGSAEGTFRLDDVSNLLGVNDYPQAFVALGDGRILFVTMNEVNKLWVTDGTGAGTQMVKQFDPGFQPPYGFTLTETGHVLFSAADGTNGTELWVSDGTAAGTGLLVDLNPGLEHGYPMSYTAIEVNDAPTGSPTATLRSAIEDTPLVLDSAALLAGFTDPDGDPLSIANLTANHGSISDNGDGSWTFTSNTNYSGALTFSYDVIDSRGGSLAASVTSNVVAVADAPTLLVSPAHGDEDSAIALDIQAVLGDSDGSEQLFVTVGALPVGATLSDGTHSFTATAGATKVAVSGWNLASLTVTPVANSHDDFTLTVRATAVEAVDGRPDIMTAQFGTSGNAIYLNEGGFSFTDSGALYANNAFPYDLSIGDVDGDGDADFAVSGDNLYGRIVLNNGDGTFSDSGNQFPAVFQSDNDFADIDNDGDLDVMFNNIYQGIELYANDGSGHFTQAQSLLSSGPNSMGGAFSDFNSDGFVDLLMARDGTNAWRQYFNDGTGHFIDPGQSVASNGQILPEAADFDGDGDIDALGVGYNGPTRIWLNDGTGQLVDSGQPIAGSGVTAAALGDVDGDGDTDVVLGGATPVRLWLNDGNALFSDGGAIGSINGGISLADFDNDGDLDAVRVQQTSFTFFTNNGNGVFTPASSITVPALQTFGVDNLLESSDVNTSLHVTVDPVNDLPVLAAALADRSVEQNSALSFAVPAGTFSDADAGDTLSMSATLSAGTPLPVWLTFDAQTGTFSGTVPTGFDLAPLEVTVTATDSAGATTSDTFTLTIVPATPTEGDDVLYGTQQFDSIAGLGGHDQIYGGGGDDVLAGDSGNDLILGGHGNDTIFGGEGNDTLYSDGPVNNQFGTIDFVDGGNGNDFILGSHGNSTLIGGAGADNLVLGFAPNSVDTVDAGSDDDLIQAGDRLNAGDRIDGGPGFDRLTVFGDYAAGIAFGSQTLVNVEHIEIAGGGSKMFTMHDATVAAGQTLTVQSFLGATEVLTFLGGAETNGTFVIVSGAGNDFINTGNGNDIVDGGSGNDRLFGNVGRDTLVGGAGNDLLAGQFGVDVLTGGTGVDQFNFGTGDGNGDRITDYEYGEKLFLYSAPNDLEQYRLRFDGSDSYLDIDTDGAGDFDMSIILSGSINGLLSLTQESIGSDVYDVITIAQANAVYGSQGDDSLVSAASAPQHLFGLRGNDFVNAGTGNDSIYGGSGNDELYGNFGSDTIFGGDGNDVLLGQYDADVLSGGAGVDQYNFSVADGNGDRITDYEYGEKLFVLGAPTNLEQYRLRFDGTDSYLDIDTDGAGDFDMSIVLSGPIQGLLSLTEEVRADLTFQAVSITQANAVYGGQFNDTIGHGSSAAVTLFGLRGNDLLVGNVGNDNLFGGSGDDVLTGGSGADQLQGGAHADTASYAGSAGAVTVNLATGTGSGGDAQGDTLAGIEHLIGSAFADALIGDAGSNLLRGGAGADILNGGAGIDTADYSTAPGDAQTGRGVRVNLASGKSDFSDAQGDQLSGIENLTGSAFNDTLNGNAAANRLLGGAGNDVLSGGTGADLIYGGTGNDILAGNVSGTADGVRDTFVFDTALSAATNRDSISSFEANALDKMALDPALFAAIAGGPTVGLDASEFRSRNGGNAVDSNDYIVYDPQTGNLFYDADGSGAAMAKVQFAALIGVIGTLDYTDFTTTLPPAEP